METKDKKVLAVRDALKTLFKARQDYNDAKKSADEAAKKAKEALDAYNQEEAKLRKRCPDGAWTDDEKKELARLKQISDDAATASTNANTALRNADTTLKNAQTQLDSAKDALKSDPHYKGLFLLIRDSDFRANGEDLKAESVPAGPGEGTYGASDLEEYAKSALEEEFIEVDWSSRAADARQQLTDILSAFGSDPGLKDVWLQGHGNGEGEIGVHWSDGDYDDTNGANTLTAGRIDHDLNHFVADWCGSGRVTGYNQTGIVDGPGIFTWKGNVQFNSAFRCFTGYPAKLKSSK